MCDAGYIQLVILNVVKDLYRFFALFRMTVFRMTEFGVAVLRMSM